MASRIERKLISVLRGFTLDCDSFSEMTAIGYIYYNQGHILVFRTSVIL